MRIIHLRYSTLAALRQDVQTAFPDWDGTKEDVPQWLDNHAYVKIVRDESGTILFRDVYLLVRDSFILPGWIRGVELTGQQTHTFLGYELNGG